MDWRSRRMRSSSCQCFLSSYCDDHDCVSSASWTSPHCPCCCGDLWISIPKHTHVLTWWVWTVCQTSHILWVWLFVPFLCCWMSLKSPGCQRTSCGVLFAESCPCDSEQTGTHSICSVKTRSYRVIHWPHSNLQYQSKVWTHLLIQWVFFFIMIFYIVD